MADLKEFLGGLVSSISESRVLSDLQTLEIAKQYAKDNLLQNFAIPRMRIENVELTIPCAIDESKVVHKEELKEGVNNISISSKTYQIFLKLLAVNQLPEDVSKRTKSKLNDFVNLLEAEMAVGTSNDATRSYLRNVNDYIIKQLPTILKSLKMKQLNQEGMVEFQNRLEYDLEYMLKEELKPNQVNSTTSYSNIIVEATKLRELKSENLIYIKMKISEQGMEWFNMENKDGEIISKLMPE